MASKKDTPVMELVLEDTDELTLEIADDFVMPGVGLIPISQEDLLVDDDINGDGLLGGLSDDLDDNFITDIDDAVEALTWCIYGKNGTGKTTALKTATGVLVLAAEDGTLSIRGAKDAKKIKIDSWSKLEKAYWKLANGTVVTSTDAKGIKHVGIEIDTNTGKFIVYYVAFDTVTKLAETCMRNVVLKGVESDTKDVIKRTLKDWGEMTEKMKFWVQKFLELPIQKILICQENSNSDSTDSDEFSIYPALSQSLRTYVLSEADIIARTYIARNDTGGMEYRLSARANVNFVTKDRTSVLNRGVLPNPNFDKMYNAIFKPVV